MAPAITASLVSSDVPQAVQVVVTGVAAGLEVLVEGTTPDGSSWSVPGGDRVSDGGQIVLTDTRSALNTPVTYRLTVDGAVYSAAPVTVAYGGQAVLQSLDGQTTVEFVWRENGLPQEPELFTATFSVPGRLRPPARFVPAGDGGGSLSIRTSRANSERLRSLVRTGRPLVMRTDGNVRDFPAVELLLPTSVSSELWPVVTAQGMSTDRVWSIGYLLVDDPEPGTAITAFTWDDFDQAMAARTWDDFDALFASSDWNDFDTADWDQYT